MGFLESFSEPTNGPACGFPSFPSTGASFVPTSYFALAKLTMDDGLGSNWAASRGWEEVVTVDGKLS